MKVRFGGLALASTMALFGFGCDAIFGDSDVTIPIPTGGIGDPCTGDSTCRTGLYCESGDCTARADLQAGDECEFTASCGAGLYCNHGRVCAAAGEGAEGTLCTSTAECVAGLVCDFDGFTPRCLATGDGDLGKTCVNGADCFAGLSCASNRCISLPAMDGEPPPPIPPTWVGAMCPDEDAPPETAAAIFELPADSPSHGDFFRLPYPNDIRRSAEGLNLSGFPSPAGTPGGPVIDAYVGVTEELGGFSPSSAIHFRFTHEPKIGLADLQLVNLDTGNDHGSKRYIATSGGRFSKYMCPFWVAISPNTGDPFAPGTTYAAIVKSTAVPADSAAGASFARSAELEMLLASSDPGGAASAAWRAYAPLRDWIASEGVDASTILNAAVFTTGEPALVSERVRAAVQIASAPTISGLTLCDGSATSPCDDGTPGRGCPASPDGDFHELHARVTLPLFQKGTVPYEDIADGGGFEFGGTGLPIAQGTVEACMTVTVPKTAMPETGYPAVVYAHGTGGSFRSAVNSGVASDMATNSAAPAMTIAIDLPQHGDRRGDSDQPSELLFFNFNNPGAAWGNVMQGASDIMALARWASSWSVSAASSPTGAEILVDAEHLGFYGHSQGSTHGALVLPFEPRFSVAILSGNGGYLAESLLNKKQPIDISSVVPFALADFDSEGKLPGGVLHPVMTLFQTYFDSVDGLNHAQFVVANPRGDEPYQHVFMTYGLGDSFSPEQTMYAYAVEGRFPIVGPILTETWPSGAQSAPYTGSPKTVAIRQYMPGDYDGHFVATRNAQGRADVTNFLSAALAGETPSVGN